MLYLVLGLIFFLLVLLFGGGKFKKTHMTINFSNIMLSFIFLLLFILGIIFIRGSFQIFLLISFIALAFYFTILFIEWKKSKKTNLKSDLSSMTRKQALAILGLNEDADRETIQKTHRELLKRLHPDCGGSNYLTAMINEAKNILISD